MATSESLTIKVDECGRGKGRGASRIEIDRSGAVKDVVDEAAESLTATGHLRDVERQTQGTGVVGIKPAR